MFLFRKKTELEQLIALYGKDTETLLEFARTVKKPTIREVTPEDIKEYHKSVIERQNSLYRREAMMKEVRRFFRYYRGLNILKPDQIAHKPLQSVGENVMVEPMKEKKKEGRGRPIDMEMIKKVKFLIDEGGLSIRAVARAEGKNEKTIHTWYHYPKGYKSAKLLVK